MSRIRARFALAEHGPLYSGLKAPRAGAAEPRSDETQDEPDSVRAEPLRLLEGIGG
jgi:hypothetical protein